MSSSAPSASSSSSSSSRALSRLSQTVTHLVPHGTAAQGAASIPAGKKSSVAAGPILSGGLEAAKGLAEQGVKLVFTLTGGHIAPILVGCNSIGIKVIDVRDEVTTVFAADAVSRLTGIVGVAIVTAGPGLTNTITAVKNAQLAQSPVVIFAGATATLLKGRGSLQDIDQFALMKPHCKSIASIRTVREIIPTLRAAFRTAQEGVPGPVFIEFPLDTIWPREILMPMLGVKEESAWPSLSQLASGKFTEVVQQVYLNRHLNNIFHQAYEVHPALTTAQLVVAPIKPSSSQVDSVARTLFSAKRPVFVIGSQAVRPLGIKSLIASFNSLEIPVYLSGMARGLLGVSHPLQMRHKRGQALQKADFILLLGVPADFRLEYGRHIGRNAYFVTVNLCATTLKKNNDIRNPDVRVHADSILFLEGLAEKTATLAGKEKKVDRKEWMSLLNKLQDQREKEIADMLAKERRPEVDDENANFISPILLCKELDKAIGEKSVIVADGGDFVGTASYIVRPRGPLTWLDPGVFGTLGVGGGFSLGAQLVRGSDTEIWAIYGDGSVGWSLSEFDTYVRFKVPIIAVIGNDACWSQMWRDQVRLLKDPVATELTFSRYDLVAEGFGAKGFLLRRQSQIAEVFAEAKRVAASGRPVLINAMLLKSGFREGSISL